MSIVKPCPYDINGEHCKYEIYYGEPIFSKCKNCSRTRTIFKRCIEMTNEEMAEERLISYRKEPKWAGKMFMKDENTCYKEGFLAGLKAGRPKWHKVADGDLPPTSGEMHAERYQILACTKNGYVTVAIRRKHGRAYEWFCSDYDGSTLYLDKEVIAWCEIPKYTEE